LAAERRKQKRSAGKTYRPARGRAEKRPDKTLALSGRWTIREKKTKRKKERRKKRRKRAHKL
jgi:hypothetical protein